MTLKVLVIAEGSHDPYMLKPIVGAMFKSLKKSQVKIRFQLLQGISRLKSEKIEKIIDRYPLIDLFLLCVDRDGEATRREELNYIEKNAKELLSETKIFFAENAWQEIEVWVLAGHSLPSEWNWQEIRQEPNPKEIYFEPFAKQQNVSTGLAGGRKKLAESADYKRIRQLCPEDIQNLEQRIKSIL